MLDLFFRAFSRQRWLTVATNRGIYDADGNINPGFEVDELGNVGDDTWWMVNLRIHGQRADDDADDLYPGETGDWRFLRSKLARFVREQATLVIVRGIRAYQWGVAAQRFQLLDPRDIPVPPRVWAGGIEL